MRFVAAAIQGLDENQLKILEAQEEIELVIEGEKVMLSIGDVDIQSKDI
jgi:uncharacterized protein YacL (UPF0231 family)